MKVLRFPVSIEQDLFDSFGNLFALWIYRFLFVLMDTGNGQKYLNTEYNPAQHTHDRTILVVPKMILN